MPGIIPGIFCITSTYSSSTTEVWPLNDWILTANPTSTGLKQWLALGRLHSQSPWDASFCANEEDGQRPQVEPKSDSISDCEMSRVDFSTFLPRAAAPTKERVAKALRETYQRARGEMQRWKPQEKWPFAKMHSWKHARINCFLFWLFLRITTQRVTCTR